MSKSVLVIDTPENCYDCPFGTEYCGNLEYEGCCELSDCLDYDVILMTEEHYDCESKSRPDWCPLKPLPEKRDTKMTGADWNCGYNDGWNACVDEIIIRSKSPEEIIKYYENKNIQIKRKAAQEAQTSALTTPLKKPLSNAMFNGMLWKIV